MGLARKYVRGGQLIPHGYGFAFYRPNSLIAVFYPWPLNLLARWSRDLWWFVRHAPRDRAIEGAYRDGFNKGREATDAHILEVFKILKQQDDSLTGAPVDGGKEDGE